MIGAKTIFPIHTEQPEMFKKVSENWVLMDEVKNTSYNTKFSTQLIL